MVFLMWSGAFLKHDGKVLLLRRSETRRYHPGKWSYIGGNIEIGETPIEACYREITEESGISRESVISLNLLYILIRQTGGELRQNYIYFGESLHDNVIDTDEGQLSWVNENELAQYDFSATYKAMIEHYMARNPADRNLYVGVSEIENDILNMTFTKCEDFG